MTATGTPATHAFALRPGCPLCGDPGRGARALIDRPLDHPSIFSFIERYYEGRIAPTDLDGGSFTLLRCAACDFCWHRSVLDARGMALLYSRWIDNELSRRKKDDADVDRALRAAAEVAVACRLLNKRPHELSALDFGMGWGHWAGVARAMGVRSTGLEVDESRLAHARALGVEAVSDLGAFRARRFHLVRANQVFEHIEDPLGALRALVALMAPGGLAYLTVPDCESALEKLADPAWSAAKDELHPLEHINCFTRGSLIGLATRAGLVHLDLAEPVVSCATDLRPMLSPARTALWFRRSA